LLEKLEFDLEVGGVIWNQINVQVGQ
jgi:hypothetical protein